MGCGLALLGYLKPPASPPTMYLNETNLNHMKPNELLALFLPTMACHVAQVWLRILRNVYRFIGKLLRNLKFYQVSSHTEKRHSA